MTKTSKNSADISRRDFLVAGAGTSGLVIAAASGGAVAKPARRTIFGESKMDVDRFVEECVAANKETDSQAAVLEVLARTVRTPDAVLAAIGEPKEAGLRVLLRSKTLTIFTATWTPQMTLMPHNHLMWANIGLYTGREDNILWRRHPASIEAYGVKALFRGDAVALAADTIHSVTNPLQRFTAAIHIYGGDFFDTTRSQWNPETLSEEKSDGEVIRAIFARENERMRRCGEH